MPFVEFDLQLEDGRVVVAHDVGGAEDLEPEQVLLALADAGAGAHLDLKFGTADGALEIAAVARAVELLGLERLVVTTGREEVLRALRGWAEERGLALRLGLSLGQDVAGRPLREQVAIRWSELRPRRRLEGCGADVVVAHWSLARLGVAGWARRHGVPLVVWTVDADRELRHWLAPGRAWLVTTNRPERALELSAAARRRRR